MFDTIRRMFKAAPAPVVSDKPLQGEVAWGEISKMYAGANIPKYNPDELIGRKGMLVYARMMTDEQIKAVIRFKRDAITSRQFYFKCAHDALGEDECAARIAICDSIVDQMAGSWGDVFNGIMSAMYMGFSLSEKVFKFVEINGKTWVGLKAIKIKPANTFWFHVDEFSNIIKVTQQFGSMNGDIDIARFIHYVQNPEHDLHYGQSELREVYRSWFSKDMAIRFQNIHLERFAGGFVVATPEGNKTIQPNSADHINLQNILNNINAKTSILLPAGIKMEVHQPATSDIFERTIAQHDKAMARAMLVPNLLGVSEQGSHGSLAQAATQLEAFMWTLEGDSNRLAEVLNEQLWKDIGDQNWGDGMYPEMQFKPISEARKMDIIGKWTDLVTAGAVEATDTDEEHLRDLLEFPDKGTAIAKPAPAVPPGAAPNQGAPTQAAPIKQAQEETIAGQSLVTVSAFSRAVKRVDFSVIGNKADIAADDTTHEVAIINSDAVARMMADAESMKLGTADGLPMDVFKIKYTADELGKMRQAVGAGIKASWAIGIAHGKRELQKARANFAANDLALQDMAANWMKNKSFTITGDISTATQRRIQGLLTEGIKVSKTFAETKAAIYKALEGDGLLTEEAVVVALGAMTVKDASARINTVMRTNSFEAINEARYELFSDPGLNGFVEALEYAAVLDDRTTEICTQLNGDTFPIDDPVWQTYRPPNHFNAIAAGELIQTRRGLIAIEHVCVGDEVMTHSGHWSNVYAVMGKQNDTNLIRRIKISSGGSLLVTDEHPILTTHGWFRADELKIGDELFQRAEQWTQCPFSGCAFVEQAILLDAHNRKPMINEETIAYQVNSRTPGMTSSIQFKIHFSDKEIHDVGMEGDLHLMADVIFRKYFGNRGFVECEISPESARAIACGLFPSLCNFHRVIGAHRFRMLCSELLRRLQVLGSPVFQALRALAIGHVQAGRVILASDGYSMAFASGHQSCLPESQFPFNLSNRFVQPEMLCGNKSGNNIPVFGINHGIKNREWITSTIISNDAEKYNGKVFNLAVEEDETYMAGNILVHNCRSILVPVTQNDQWATSELPDSMPQKGFGFHKQCNHSHHHEAHKAAPSSIVLEPHIHVPVVEPQIHVPDVITLDTGVKELVEEVRLSNAAAIAATQSLNRQISELIRSTNAPTEDIIHRGEDKEITRIVRTRKGL